MYGWYQFYKTTARRRMAKDPITRDEVLDMHERLKDVNTLRDLGITGPYCLAYITRWTGLTGLTGEQVACLLTGGHNGAHQTEREEA